MKKNITLFGFLLIIASHAFAGSCTLKAGGNYDTILNSFYTVSSTWADKLYPKVKLIFWGFFAAEFLYQITFKKILSNDISKLYVFFVTRIFTGYMFAQIFLDLNFYVGIITFFTNLGSSLGGISMPITSGAGGMGITPSAVMSYFECEFKWIFAAFTAASLIPGVGGFFVDCLFVLLILMNLVSITVLITMLDAYVVIFAGFILTGFSGSSWTQSWWQKYLSYVFGTGIRLFITCLVLGLVVNVFTTFTVSSNPLDWASDMFTLLGILLACVYIVLTIPNKAASMLSGAVSGGLGDAIGAASTMMSSMGGAGALSKAGGAMMGGIGGAASAGKSAALGKARELLGGGVGGGGNSVGAGDPSKWKSAVKSEAGAAGKAAAKDSIAGGWKGAVDALRGGSGGANGGNNGGLKKLGDAAKQAGKAGGSGHAGGADLNINPHKE